MEDLLQVQTLVVVVSVSWAEQTLVVNMVLVVEVDSKEWVAPRSWCNPEQRQLDIPDMTRVSRVEEEDTCVSPGGWQDDGASGQHQGIGNHSLQIENFFYMTRVQDHHVARVHLIFC